MIPKLLTLLNKYSIYLFSLALVFIFVIHLINGEDNIIKIYDNLDSEITSRLLPKRAGNLFSFSNDEVVPQLVNGLKRNCLNVGSRNIETLLFYWFPPIWAYLINWILINAIAFAGFYLLLSKYILKDIHDRNKLLAATLAFTFVMLPAYTIYGMAVLGVPMLGYCILNILNKKNIVASGIFVVVYPFYSSLVLGGFIVVGALFVLGIWYYFKKQKTYAFTLIGISIIMGGLYIISEVNLFNQFFFDRSFVSHRTDWDPTFDQILQIPETLGFWGALERAKSLFLIGEINAKVFPQLIMIFFVVVLMFQFRSMIRDRYLMGLALLIVLVALLYGFYFSGIKPWIYLKNNVMLLKTIRIDRIFFFWPVMWYVLFALLIKKMFDSKKEVLIIVAFVFLFANLLFVMNGNREMKANAVVFLGNKSHSMISWKRFFAEDLFKKVKADIAEPIDSYRVVSIGLTPAVSLYNGFYTLDIYSNNYPLAYKYQFREVIAPELEKSDKHRISFDKWGGECFVFSSEIQYRPEFIPFETELQNLELNTTALYHLGGRYIFSALEIKNYQENNLELYNKYTDESTPLTLWVYRVLPP